MKNILIVIVFLTLSIISKAQSNEQNDYIIISGKIENVKVKMDGKKTIDLYYPHYMNKGMAGIVIKLTDENTFIDTIISDDGLYHIWDSKNLVPIYLNKSNKYTIRYNADEFDNGGLVMFGGGNVSTNKYFVEKMQQGDYNVIEKIDSNENEYRQLLTDIRKKQLSKLENAKIPEEIKMDERLIVHYDYLAQLCFFIGTKKYYNPTFEPSEISKNELNVDYNDELKYRKYHTYSSLVDRFISNEIDKVEKYYKKSDSTYNYHQYAMKLLDSLISNDHIRNEHIEQMGVSSLRASHNKDAFYKDYQKYYTGDDEAFKMKMDKSYLSFSKLKKGGSSPEFNDYRNYNGGTNSLKDFRNKYVYIDIWAIWCGNCWGEMPYLKTLEESYRNKNIVFVSLSVDKYEKDWKAAIVNKQMEGIQLLVKSKEDPFIQEYAIGSIPRYILIDPDGNIVDYNAPRPSEKEKLDALFASLGL